MRFTVPVLIRAVTAACLFLALCALPGPASAQVQNRSRQLTIERIEIQGNTKTSREVIFRYLSIKPGDAINPVVLEANRRRLDQTNFFKEVDIYTRPGSVKGTVVVVVEIKERHWPYFQFEGGHSDLSGWYFVPVSFRFDNLFGKGNFIGLKLMLGDRISKLSIGYRNPNLFDDQGFLDVELFAGSQEFIHYFGRDRASQMSDWGGLRFTVGGNHGIFQYLNFSYRIETFTPDLTADFTNRDSTLTDFPNDIADDLPKTQIGAFSLILNADLRDNPVYPLKGFWGALSVELAHDQVGSDRNFSKFTFDGRFYQKFFRRNVFAFHLKGGYIRKQAPFYERFFLGGANSLRGYPDRRLTPVGYGTKLILTNTEIRFPLSSRNFPYHRASGVLFFDAGGLWLPGQTPRIEDIFASVGFGYRIKLPIVGITRFDFAFPLNRVDENDFQFHISLGHTF
ncbi:MAG: outer membrane protein assembly factor [bacterium]